MFPNLRAEIARHNISSKELAKGIGIAYDSLKNKLNGRTEFTRLEMFRIKKQYFPNCTVDYLFSENINHKEAS